MGSPRPTESGASPRNRGWLVRARDFLAWLFRSEELPPASARAAAPAGPGFLRWLLASEPLPEIAPGSKAPTRPFAAWLFAAERLPRGDAE